AMPIPGVLAGHIDTRRLGVLGHSLGGGTAAEVCRSDARVVACADLDGKIYGPASASGLGQPFLLVESDGRADTFDEFAGRLRGPSCRVRGARVSHLDLCDVPLLLPIVTYLLPQPSLRNAGGADSLGAMNELLGAFFDATVRGDAASWSRVRSPPAPFSAVCERLPR
ncbi:MAG TPA: hypothetical protein VKB80_21995, partial [Kofleriaceae bacterium]|nr:hypothetical protein [Kofleriaceae bacterium]